MHGAEKPRLQWVTRLFLTPVLGQGRPVVLPATQALNAICWTVSKGLTFSKGNWTWDLETWGRNGEQERRKVEWLDEGQATRLLSQQSN